MSGISTRHIRVIDILVPTRIRKGAEKISELAEDIRSRGLINPITVMDAGDNSYVLIAGLRRLKAITRNGDRQIRATVLSPMDADEMLMMEFAENEHRCDFSVSERLEYAEKIKAIEQVKARQRMSAFANESHGQGTAKRPYLDKGETREIVAKKAGFSSTTQFRRASEIAAKRPDLLDKIDQGETTIYGAYKEVEARGNDDIPAHTSQMTSYPRSAPEASTQIASVPNDQVARAKHERLMKNPLYADLFARHDEAVKEANHAKGELLFQVEGYEKMIRGDKENIRAIIRERDVLLAENRELRRRLGLSETEPVIGTDTNAESRLE